MKSKQVRCVQLVFLTFYRVFPEKKIVIHKYAL